MGTISRSYRDYVGDYVGIILGIYEDYIGII